MNKKEKLNEEALFWMLIGSIIVLGAILSILISVKRGTTIIIPGRLIP